MSKISRVLLVDDHPMMLFGMSHLIGTLPSFEVCGEVGDASSAKEFTSRLLPDIIILDLALGGRDGPELIAELRKLHPSVGILVYSALPELLYAPRVFRVGANGYLSKENGLDQIPEAIATIMEGEIYASPKVHREFFRKFVGKEIAPAEDRIATLGDRELQVLRMLAHRKTIEEIAAELRIGVKTVGTHRERLKQKLGVESASELLRLAEDFLRSGSI